MGAAVVDRLDKTGPQAGAWMQSVGLRFKAIRENRAFSCFP